MSYVQRHWDVYRQAEESLVIAYKTKVDIFHELLQSHADPGIYPTYPSHDEVLNLAHRILDFIYSPHQLTETDSIHEMRSDNRDVQVPSVSTNVV